KVERDAGRFGTPLCHRTVRAKYCADHFCQPRFTRIVRPLSKSLDLPFSPTDSVLHHIHSLIHCLLNLILNLIREFIVFFIRVIPVLFSLILFAWVQWPGCDASCWVRGLAWPGARA